MVQWTAKIDKQTSEAVIHTSECSNFKNRDQNAFTVKWITAGYNDEKLADLIFYLRDTEGKKRVKIHRNCFIKKIH